MSLPLETIAFTAELDAAVEAHMNWTRGIVRCAVLRSAPGDDVLDPLAHTLCRFGAWFLKNRRHFETLDAPAAERVEVAHQAMHDAIRSICTRVMAGEPGRGIDLENFEQSQSELISLLANFKTLTLLSATRSDPLTGLPLRNGIESDFSLHQKDAQRNHTLLYVVMIDVDHFKLINDTYGHPVGDRVLRDLAAALKRALRGNEPLYRFGGEEFLWLLHCNSPDEAEQSARRVLHAVRTTPVPIAEDKSIVLTVTLGLAQVGELESLASATGRADLALYEGKANGRNCFVADHC